MHLLRALTAVSDVSDSNMPFIQHMRTIVVNPLASKITGSRDNLDAVIESINWFLSNPKYIQFLNTDERTLKVMLDVAETIQSSPSDSVCRSVAAKLEGSNSYSSRSPSEKTNKTNKLQLEDAEEELDEETDTIKNACSDKKKAEERMAGHPASIVQSVLYGIFYDFPRPAASAMTMSIPVDSGEEAIRQTAAVVNSRFSGASIEAVREHRLDEMIVLALLHSGPDFEKWHEEFKPTLDFLAAVNNRDIPTSVSERHLNLVKQRRK
jgi:hypothetical protein